VESALGHISEAFGALLGSWYDQDRWRGEFVPKGPDLHPPFRQAAAQICDAVLARYILDVVCGDTG
jgi:hypothetical protein